MERRSFRVPDPHFSQAGDECNLQWRYVFFPSIRSLMIGMNTDLLSGLIDGLIAGYGIAIPIGAISLLIIDLSMRHGFRLGFAAGAGAASVDFSFALLAAFAGDALSGVIAPYESSIQTLSGITLIMIAIWGVINYSRRTSSTINNPSAPGKPLKIFVQFIALTAINPLTIAYFSALILSREAGSIISLITKVSFVLGAGFASFSWQLFLAALGSFAQERLDPRFQVFTTLFGNAVIIVLGINILF